MTDLLIFALHHESLDKASLIQPSVMIQDFGLRLTVDVIHSHQDFPGTFDQGDNGSLEHCT